MRLYYVEIVNLTVSVNLPLEVEAIKKQEQEGREKDTQSSLVNSEG